MERKALSQRRGMRIVPSLNQPRIGGCCRTMNHTEVMMTDESTDVCFFTRPYTVPVYFENCHGDIMEEICQDRCGKRRLRGAMQMDGSEAMNETTHNPTLISHHSGPFGPFAQALNVCRTSRPKRMRRREDKALKIYGNSSASRTKQAEELYICIYHG